MSLDALAFLAEFQAEVTEHLNALDHQLLLLEQEPLDPRPVRAMFLAAHSMKGGAAMLGLIEFRDLSHALEDVLGVLRDHGRPLDRTTADVLFRAVDQLRALLPEADGTPHPISPETVAVVAELAACTTALHPPRSAIDDPAERVLLVEDSPSVRRVETFLLQDAGFVVDCAQAANEALALAKVAHYVLVVAGIETRELRGPDLVLALRAGGSGPPVPVLLTTTDFAPVTAAPGGDVVIAPKGNLRSADFLRIVRQLTRQQAAA